MLVVKLEIWPLGNEAQAREIGRMRIGNVGGDHDGGEYDVEFEAEAKRGDAT